MDKKKVLLFSLSAAIVVSVSAGVITSFVIQNNKKYSVELAKNNENAGSVFGGGTYKKNEAINIYCETNEGYSFDGIFNGTEKVSSNNNYSFQMPSSDMNFIFKWSLINYTINYSLNGGVNSNSNPLSYNVESEDIHLANPQKNGYSFSHWTNKGETVLVISKGSTGNLNLEASWIENSYKVTFDSNGGSCSEKILNVSYDSYYSLPIPSREGYSFSGWFDGDTMIQQSGIWEFTADKTLTAHWSINPYTINFDSNGGESSISSLTVTYGSSYDFPTPTKSGYTFDGWFDGDSKIEQSGIWQIAENKNLVAHWTINTYVISLDPNGGECSKTSVDVKFGNYFSLPTPTKTGYRFDGWFDGDIKFSNFAKWNYMENKNLQAHWTARSYKITFNTDGGSCSDSTLNVTYDSLYELPVPTKSGFTFLGWFKNFEKVEQTGIWQIAEDSNLVARWSGNTYHLTFNPNSGECYANSMDVVCGEKYSLPTPTKTGYTFEGWYDGDLRISSNGTWNSEGDKNLIAHWTITYFQITYFTNGGAYKSPDYYTINDEIILEDEERIGYKFEGWYCDDVKITKIPKGSYGDIELVARWSANFYSLNVQSDNNERGSASIKTGLGFYDESITVTASPNEGCVFGGWYIGDTKVSTDLVYTFKMPDHDVKLIAYFLTLEEKYAAVPVTVNNGRNILYGLYPQTHINDANLISCLNELDTPESNGWYFYNGEYYAKTVAGRYRSTVFSDGTYIVNGTTYWFKCEPIMWNVLTDNDSKLMLVSTNCLDTGPFDDTEPWSSNYKESDIRLWLNTDFYNTAFGLGNFNILTTEVDNGLWSTYDGSTQYYTNDFICDNTNDKVFLLSVADLNNKNYYGFEDVYTSSSCRLCNLTDWALARGASTTYWTRSPVTGSSVRTVSDYWGMFGSKGVSGYSAGFYEISIRPAITISFNSK